MVLTTTTISAVTPRGGRPGTSITIDGADFGVATGTVTFDPQGENLPAAITSWTPTQVVCVVPALTQENLFVDLLLVNSLGTDQDFTKFWVPVTDPAAGPFPPGLDYQLPGLEVGTLGENTDIPGIMSAADFNRLLDRVLELGIKLGLSLDPKDSVQAASTANVAGVYDATGGVAGRGRLTGMPNVLDGVALQDSPIPYRTLLKDQTSQDQNGIWEVLTAGSGADGIWERAADFDEDDEVTNGAFVMVTGGTVNIATRWVLVTADPVTIGGASGSLLVWEQRVTAGILTTGDKNLTPLATSGEGSTTGITISATPVGSGYVGVSVNGVQTVVGDGTKVGAHAYFSADGGTTAKAMIAIVAGDTLFWNGVTAGADLAVTDRVDLNYQV